MRTWTSVLTGYGNIPFRSLPTGTVYNFLVSSVGDAILALHLPLSGEA